MFLKAQTRLPPLLFSEKLRRLFSQQKGNKLSRSLAPNSVFENNQPNKTLRELIVPTAPKPFAKFSLPENFTDF